MWSGTSHKQQLDRHARVHSNLLCRYRLSLPARNGSFSCSLCSFFYFPSRLSILANMIYILSLYHYHRFRPYMHNPLLLPILFSRSMHNSGNWYWIDIMCIREGKLNITRPSGSIHSDMSIFLLLALHFAHIVYMSLQMWGMHNKAAHCKVSM